MHQLVQDDGSLSEAVHTLAGSRSVALDTENWVRSVVSFDDTFGLVAGLADEVRRVARSVNRKWFKGVHAGKDVFLPQGKSRKKAASRE